MNTLVQNLLHEGMKHMKSAEGSLGLAAACGGRLIGVSARKRKRRIVA